MITFKEGEYVDVNDIDKVNDLIDTLLPSLTVTKGRYSRAVYNTPVSFDIETSSFFNDNGEKTAIMYLWGVAVGGDCIIGRTWDELLDLFNKFSCRLSLQEEKKQLIIYVHNLSYEFQFLCKRMEWREVFATDERKVLYARAMNGIEFRCSYLLSAKSLNAVGEELTKYHLKKLVGNLDYRKIRHSKTPLSKKEIDYMINDCLVVNAYIDEMKDLYKSIKAIPYTSTGRVRKYCRGKLLNKDTFKKYNAFISSLTISPTEYEYLRRTYCGGFTHANAQWTGRECKKISSFDFTSSYPFIMVSEKLPMSSPHLVGKPEYNLDFYLSHYACFFELTLEGVTSRIEYEHYLSSSRCSNMVNVVADNGRIVTADKLTTYCTELDYEIIKKCYQFKHFSITNFYTMYKGYLPKAFIDIVLHFYKQKTSLKGVAEKQDIYQRYKGMLNSLYGMCVTSPIKDKTTFKNGEWVTERIDDIDKALETYNRSKGRYLYYPWGVWVTAYARYNLWTAIFECKDDYVYSDTDSVKIFNIEKHMPYFNAYNAMVKNKLQLVCDEYGYDIQDFAPKTIKGKEKMIGLWDYEGTYKRFKTLGAKRYAVETEKGEKIYTIAGLPKGKVLEYLKENKLDFWKFFTDNMTVPPEWSGKLTHTYIDTERQGVVRDYLGNVAEYHELSCVHLADAGYNLKMSKDYLDLIEMVQGARTYVGE